MFAHPLQLRIFCCGLASLLVLASCVAADKPLAKKAAATGEPVRYLVGEIPAIPGPKRVVAVGKFEALGSFESSFGSWDVGGGLAAMLVSALAESERFILVERTALEQVVAEKGLAKAQAEAAGTAAPAGTVTAAQFLLLGAITEFGGSEKGSGFSIGIGNLPGGMQGGLGPQFTKGRVVMAVRVVDTATGQIKRNLAVAEKVTATTVDVNVSKEGFSLGSNSFNKTPLGEACRRALTKIVTALAEDAAREPWVGRIVELEGEKLFINAGASSGLKTGDTFRVFRIAKVFTDPATNAVIGRREQPLGQIRIANVEPLLASGVFTAAGDEMPVRGDFVATLPNSP
ncbi:MAG: CsgG/HfaB family protein [Opitutaceae bacterium]